MALRGMPLPGRPLPPVASLQTLSPARVDDPLPNLHHAALLNRVVKFFGDNLASGNPRGKMDRQFLHVLKLIRWRQRTVSVT